MENSKVASSPELIGMHRLSHRVVFALLITMEMTVVFLMLFGIAIIRLTKKTEVY